MRATCKLCTYFDRGECHRLHPRAVIIDGKLRNLYPTVEDDDIACKNFVYNRDDDPLHLVSTEKTSVTAPQAAFVQPPPAIPQPDMSPLDMCRAQFDHRNCDGQAGNYEHTTVISLLDKLLKGK